MTKKNDSFHLAQKQLGTLTPDFGTRISMIAGFYGKIWFYNGHQGNHKPIKAYVGYQNNSIQAPKVSI